MCPCFSRHRRPSNRAAVCEPHTHTHTRQRRQRIVHNAARKEPLVKRRVILTFDMTRTMRNVRRKRQRMVLWISSHNFLVFVCAQSESWFFVRFLKCQFLGLLCVAETAAGAKWVGLDSSKTKGDYSDYLRFRSRRNGMLRCMCVCGQMEGTLSLSFVIKIYAISGMRDIWIKDHQTIVLDLL